MHVNPHALAMQLRVAPAGLGHEMLHMPHVAGLFVRFASHPSARFVLQFAKPVAHASPHTPAVQAGVAFGPDAQTARHTPQLSGSVPVFTSHPFDAFPSQSAKPAAQVIEHVPVVQTAVLFAPEGQTVPHVPQLFTSVARFVHDVPQRSGAVPTQPLTHTIDPLLEPHIGAPTGQTAPHMPQFIAVVSDVSQPFAGLASQFPKPGLHERSRSHAPDMQRTDPADTFASIVQSLPQLPQLWTSLFGSTQLVPHTRPLHASMGTSPASATSGASGTSITSITSATSGASGASIPSGSGTSIRSVPSPMLISLPSCITTSLPG
jgi:hypothetical protein